MKKPMISVEGIGKSYRLGMAAHRHASFRDAITGAITAPLRRLREMSEAGTDEDTFWALRDISFDVKRGEVLGVVGRNGAGKSTLLKVLSRITEPTEGYVRLRGRVASLLEVGTGFHPELTGRENIYLNGSILGMRKEEIDRKFDEIVEFAEITKFLDTQVKRYSSGMYVRLAFAVAAHLEPEILIVDEVLAVGDVQFQKKCLGKMKQVAKGGGRTVLFVSHNMAAVRSLCQRGILLERGRLTYEGTAEECVSRYVAGGVDSEMQPCNTFTRPGSASIWMKSATMFCNGEPSTVVPMGSEISVEMEFASEHLIQYPRLGIVISTAEGEHILGISARYQPSFDLETPVNGGKIRVDLGQVPLLARRYVVGLWFGDHFCDSHTVESALQFEVVEQDLWGMGKAPPSGDSLMYWPAKFSYSPSETALLEAAR
jgi:lipopolysaccharide transport system ATP-binding protein